MRVVIDTNVLLVSISSASVYHPIFRALVSGRCTWIVSTEIEQEYLEVISEHLSEKTAFYIGSLLTELGSIKAVEPRFKWQLLSDPDDNKFADAYVAGDGEFLVTNDRHFDVLKTEKFPVFRVVTAQEFLRLLV